MPPTRVLIVDDDAQMRTLLSLVVRLASITGDTAPDADAALAAVANCRPDAVIIDVRLKGRDGFSLASELRSAYPELRLLLMSGDLASESLRARSRALGGQFLQKPFDPSALLAWLVGSNAPR